MDYIGRYDKGPRMSQVVVCYTGTVHFSGQVASGDGIVAQTQAVLDKMEKLLNDHCSGGSGKGGKRRLLAVTIYITVPEHFDLMNEVWDKWVDPEHAPARTTVIAQLAKPEFLIEITAIAATSERESDRGAPGICL